MITRKFIKKVHDVFDELNYRETKELNFDKFISAAIRTLTHCKDLDDAKYAVLMCRFCDKKWRKIERMFNRKLQIFNEYAFEGNSLLSLVSDDEAFGTYYITNGITKKIQEIFVASHSLDKEMFSFGFGNSRFTIFEDWDYYLKYSKRSSTTMKLFNHKNECLCNIVLSKNCDIFLENNSTPYELILFDGFVGIYEREYIESLADTNTIDTKKMLAAIEWDILEENSEFGVAKLELYNADQDFEMFLLFATSTFLLFQKYMQDMRRQRYMMMYLAQRSYR